LGPDDPGSNSLIIGAEKIRAAPYQSRFNMTTEKKKLGSAKRFGARYGIKPKYKVARIEAERKKKQKCPYCNDFKATRVAVGIWKCKKCKSKFTGKAYTVSKGKIIEEEE